VVARGFGLPVRRILLYPLGGFSEIEQDPPTPGKELLVSAAGPLISLVLAAVGYALLAIAHPVGLPGLLIKQLVWANLLVGIFNLLPGLPLDGGRMLRAVVWKITGKPGSATVAAAWAGRVLAIAVLIVPLAMLFSNKAGGNAQIFDAAWLAVIAAFIWVGAGQALRATRVRERLPGLQARTLARRAIPIPASLPLAEAIRRADAAQARALVIVDHEDKPIAIVNETAVMATPPQRRPWIDAGSLSRSIDPGLVLPADLSGMALIEAVNRHRATEYLLVEPSGQVYGVLAASDLDQAFAGT
jgi:Zn-dependent protease